MPDWAYAHGGPVAAARIKAFPEDFIVVENLAFEAAGDGEHDLICLRKTGANTTWVARQLARHAGIPARDVGYSGLKDRHAVTTQFFSVRRPGGGGTDWSKFTVDGLEILDIARHDRKLRTGAHKSNDFSITLRGDEIDDVREALEARSQLAAEVGVPNYFGPQRFGRDGDNLALAASLVAGRRLKRDDRSIAISAARSLLFNAILDARVRAGTWNHLLPGDIANLDGSNSIFEVPEVSAELVRRCDEFDIHPAGTLWGEGAPLAAGEAGEVEQSAIAAHAELAAGLPKLRVDAASRALRLRPARLSIAFEKGTMRIDFRLPRGAFATSLLREIVSDR